MSETDAIRTRYAPAQLPGLMGVAKGGRESSSSERTWERCRWSRTGNSPLAQFGLRSDGPNWGCSRGSRICSAADCHIADQRFQSLMMSHYDRLLLLHALATTSCIRFIVSLGPLIIHDVKCTLRPLRACITMRTADKHLFLRAMPDAGRVGFGTWAVA
jgi:hypothetical protein